jgi:hypothetical protein
VPILVDVGEDQVGVGFVGVEDAIAVMHVDVDIGNALHAVLAAQRLDHHAQVVEHAKPSRAVAAGVVQATDGLERATARARHHA